MKNFLWLTLASLIVSCGGGSESSSGGTSGTSGTPGGSTTLDGTWDVTSYAGDNITGSSVTVSGGKLSGTISLPGEGCTRTLAFGIEGNSMTGSSTPGAGCAGGQTITLAGSRKTPQPDSETPWNGTWDIQGEGNDKGELVISGLSATAGKFKLSIAAGTATASGGSSRYNFIARKK